MELLICNYILIILALTCLWILSREQRTVMIPVIYIYFSISSHLVCMSFRWDVSVSQSLYNFLCISIRRVKRHTPENCNYVQCCFSCIFGLHVNLYADTVYCCKAYIAAGVILNTVIIFFFFKSLRLLSNSTECGCLSGSSARSFVIFAEGSSDMSLVQCHTKKVISYGIWRL
jgi:hypothetical protein